MPEDHSVEHDPNGPATSFDDGMLLMEATPPITEEPVTREILAARAADQGPTVPGGWPAFAE